MQLYLNSFVPLWTEQERKHSKKAFTEKRDEKIESTDFK